MARDESFLERAMYAAKRLKQFGHCRVDYSVFFARLCDKFIASKKEMPEAVLKERHEREKEQYQQAPWWSADSYWQKKARAKLSALEREGMTTCLSVQGRHRNEAGALDLTGTY